MVEFFPDIHPIKFTIHYGAILIAAGLVVILVILATVLIYTKRGRKQSKLTIYIKKTYKYSFSKSMCV